MSRSVTLVGYAVVVAGFVVADLVARRSGRWPTFGQAVALLRHRLVGRLVVVAGWLWVGWHVFVRATPGG